MDIPALLYGPADEVRRRCGPAVRAFLGGASWADAFCAAGMVRATSVPGLLVLNGPAPLLGGEAHFQLFLPLALLLEAERRGRAAPDQRHAAAAASLEAPWALLGLLAPKNQMLVYPPQFHRPILHAAVSSWDALDSVGPRYSVGLREGARFWDLTSNLQYVLGQLGMQASALRTRLPDGGLKDFVPPALLDAD
jgi:hypothetical protein